MQIARLPWNIHDNPRLEKVELGSRQHIESDKSGRICNNRPCLGHEGWRRGFGDNMPLRSYDIDFRGKIRSLDGNNETDNWYPKETNSTCNRIRLRKCTGFYTRQVMLDICACGSSWRNATRGKEIINELISYRFLPISFIFVFSSSIEGRVFFLLLRLSWNWSRSVLVAYEFFFRSVLFFFF